MNTFANVLYIKNIFNIRDTGNYLDMAPALSLQILSESRNLTFSF